MRARRKTGDMDLRSAPDTMSNCHLGAARTSVRHRHFCIDAFKPGSPVPVIDMLEVVKLEVKCRGLRRVGLLGTQVVMETHFYGVLDGAKVFAPVDTLLEVHQAYVSMASAGLASPEHREVFMRAGKALTCTHGCESVLLASPDLGLVFRKGDHSGFETFECAAAHTVAIAGAAMAS